MILKASVRGYIDLKECNILDNNWWSRLSYIVGEVDREDTIRLHEYSYNMYLAHLSNSVYSTEARKKLFKYADRAYKRLTSLITNTEFEDGDSDDGKLTSEHEELIKKFKEEIGDMNDPEFRKVVAEEVRRMKESCNTDDDGLDEVGRMHKRVNELKEKREKARSNIRRHLR